MLIGRIPDVTRVLVAPEGWDKDKSGPCGKLPIRDEITTAGPEMTSVWHPTPEELARLQAGAGVYLTICGRSHPPVALTVGEVPK